jgi:glycosyltransferase involved in cell wall biosynthesis
LLNSDPRIRIFHHMKNLGCWRTRLDGIIYSRGKYIILFDAGDLYEDKLCTY